MSRTDVIQSIYAGLDSGDPTALLSHLDAAAQWNEAENIPYSPGGPLTGGESVLSTVFARIGADFAEFKVDIDRIVDAGSSIVVQGRYVGTTTGGTPLNAQVAHVWDFEGDSIVRFQQYSDTWQWRQVLGTDAGA